MEYKIAHLLYTLLALPFRWMSAQIIFQVMLVISIISHSEMKTQWNMMQYITLDLFSALILFLSITTVIDTLSAKDVDSARSSTRKSSRSVTSFQWRMWAWTMSVIESMTAAETITSPNRLRRSLRLGIVLKVAKNRIRLHSACWELHYWSPAGNLFKKKNAIPALEVLGNLLARLIPNPRSAEKGVVELAEGNKKNEKKRVSCLYQCKISRDDHTPAKPSVWSSDL